MFIYTGKLQWQGEAVDELLVVVLPNGPVRVGDPIWTLSQWTRDSKGNKKVLWTQQQFIEKVTRADNGDDTFHFGAGWYKYNVQAQQAYQTIAMTMYNPGGGSSTMTLERTYSSAEQASAASARIWTGRLNWKEWADNELIVVIVPEGFGTGKPLLAFWQWKEDLNKDFRANYIKKTTQQAEAPSEGSLKFNSLSTDRYTLTCTWDEKTEKLATRVTGPYHKEDTMLDLTALIRSHSDEVTPPEFPGEKVELEVHYPRAEAALPRIQSPLPFPPTLLETLAHTASFLDRAGYLAKYAVDRYYALDKSYHALQQQIDDLNGQTQDLSGQVVSLTGENDGDKKQIDSLQKQLAQALDEAAQKEAELTKQVQDLQATLAKDQTHDAEDHKALDDAHEQIRKDQEAQAIFKKQVTVLQFQLSETDRRNKQLQAKVTEQAQQASDLQGQLAAEKVHYADLQTQASESKAKVAVLETETLAVKRTLVRTAEDLKQAQADSNDKDSIIDGLENGIVAVKKDRDAKKAAYEQFKLVTDANTKELNDEIDQLTAQLKAQLADGDIKALQDEISELKKDRDTKEQAYEQFKLVTDANTKELNDEIDQLKAQLADGDIKALQDEIADLKKDRDAKEQAHEELKKTTDATIKELEDQIATLKSGPPDEPLFPHKQPIPSPLQQSIDKHQGKASWARLSPWFGNMDGSGYLFSSLEDIDESYQLKALRFHKKGELSIQAITVEWTNGKTQTYGDVDSSKPETFVQDASKPFVAATMWVYKSTGAICWASVFAWSSDGGYKDAGGYGETRVGYDDDRGDDDRGDDGVLFLTTLAPGTWSIRGVYGYSHNNKINGLGFVWGKDK